MDVHLRKTPTKNSVTKLSMNQIPLPSPSPSSSSSSSSAAHQRKKSISRDLFPDENLEGEQESPIEFGRLKQPPPALPQAKKVVKNFMSPTISAACKMASTKKKVLTEKNDGVNPIVFYSEAFEKASVNATMNSSLVSSIDSMSSSMNESVPQKIEPVSDSQAEAGDAALPCSVSVSEEGNTEKPDSSSSLPYDPFTNYLSPRPQYLRYRPERHLERMQQLENASSEEFNLVSSTESESPTTVLEQGLSSSEEDVTSRTVEKESEMQEAVSEEKEVKKDVEEESEAQIEKIELEDEEVDEEEEEVEPRRGVLFRFFMLILLLVSGGLIFGLTYSPASSSQYPLLNKISSTCNNMDLKRTDQQDYNAVIAKYFCKITYPNSFPTSLFHEANEELITSPDLINEKEMEVDGITHMEDDITNNLPPLPFSGSFSDYSSDEVHGGGYVLTVPELSEEKFSDVDDVLVDNSVHDDEQTSDVADVQLDDVVDNSMPGDEQTSSIADIQWEEDVADEEVKVEENWESVDGVTNNALDEDFIEEENNVGEIIDSDSRENRQDDVSCDEAKQPTNGNVMSSDFKLPLNETERRNSAYDYSWMEDLSSWMSENAGAVFAVAAVLLALFTPVCIIFSTMRKKESQNKADFPQTFGVAEDQNQYNRRSSTQMSVSSGDDVHVFSSERRRVTTRRLAVTPEASTYTADSETATPSYGSFLSQEKIRRKERRGDEEITTPVRRSSRIRNKALSP